ncbi:MAG: CPBP family intramembrane metalloprotease [Ruminococcus sp.]|nr:CPBP family intramembrane metalloprotease [Ruminococcus sp.]MCM1382389.1 CPBP family intramembrane metalloprotease [Muribaculaceae bacterium]MCM1479325.1 CPBP family intramembrane metalloprotease [Muribaculaceae bacterium]
MSEKKKEILFLVIGTAGAFLGLNGVILFKRYALMSLPLGLRMAAMIVTYWLTALVPVIMMIIGREKFSDYFSTEKICGQIITGVVIGVAMSLVLTLLPHLAGFGEYVDSGKRYTHLWQFVYEFFYCILAVGLSEELVSRGFFYNKIKNICGTEIAAVIGSSVLFGLFHIFGGNAVQMIMAAFIGVFFCVCRIKIKGCTLLSLVIAHGVYDALITVWASVLL